MEKFEKENYVQKISDAFSESDKEKVATQLSNILQEVQEDAIKRAMKDFEALQSVKEEQDKEQILASRGHRILTSDEKKFYQGIIDYIKDNKEVSMSFADFLTSVNGDLMPETIIIDTLKDLVKERPALKNIIIQYVGYSTKIILNAHPDQAAAWGKLTEKVKEEITSAFKELEIKPNKLSCFAVISNDYLALGPTFIDTYIRTTLKEAIGYAIEHAMFKGNGLDQPIGYIKNIKKGVEFSTTTGYKDKDKVKVTDFKPASYGELIGDISLDEDGKNKDIDIVSLAVNSKDYFTKIMPSTTLLSSDGTYKNDRFPFPTDVVRSRAIDTGEAVLYLPKEYMMVISTQRKEEIEVSKDFKFLDDETVFKIVNYVNGRPIDNTSALYLDISGLKPLYAVVEIVNSGTGTTTSNVESNKTPTTA